MALMNGVVVVHVRTTSASRYIHSTKLDNRLGSTYRLLNLRFSLASMFRTPAKL